MGRIITDRKTYERVKESVFTIFSERLGTDPFWFLGIHAPGAGDPKDTDFILELDIGPYPVMLCTSIYELRQLIDDWHYTGILFLLIRPEYDEQEIKEKSIYYFNRERRVRRSQMGIRDRKPARR